MSSSMTISFLGPPRIIRNDKDVGIRLKKAIALLAYLSCGPDHCTREALARLLWPEIDLTAGLANLRKTLSILRNAIGSDFISADFEAISLRLSGVSIDVRDFRTAATNSIRHLNVEETEHAINLYGGHFLDGFLLHDCPDFDNWQFRQQESLRTIATELMDSITKDLMNSGELSRASDFAQKWLEIDEWDERAQRTAMRIYASSGQKGAALRQYNRCIKLFAEEGLEPDLKTLAMRVQIAKGHLYGIPTKQ